MSILERLQSSDEPSIQKFSIYLPDKDQDKEDVRGLDAWIASAVRILTDINGGSTRLPAARGTWKGKAGAILEDNTVIVYSFIKNPDEFEDRFEEITAFVHEFGKGANQEAVLIELTDGHRAYFVHEDAYI